MSLQIDQELCKSQIAARAEVKRFVQVFELVGLDTPAVYFS